MSSWTALFEPEDDHSKHNHFEGAFFSKSGPGGDPEGARWVAGSRLTLSFAPDGTQVSNSQSQLYETFSDLLGAGQLEDTILQAFQTWARESNINIGLVTDDGSPFGSGGPTQTNERFGDIRIGSAPMDPSVFAISVKHDELISGSWAGDVLFNSNADFQSVDQLFTVIMHEAGHVFGLEHATNTASVMHPFAGVSALHTEDISGLQQIYGVRALDPYEEDEGNNSFDDATKIENSGSLKGSIPLVVYGDIHDQNDADYYFLKELSNYRGPISFRLISDGISLLKPTMTVFNEDGETVTQVSGSGNRGVDLTVTVSGADDEEFFVRVEGVDGSGLNQTGAYSLVATFDNNVSVDPERLEQVVREDYEFLDQDDVQELFMDPQTAFFKDDLHANDSFATSSELKTTPGYVEKTHFSIQASLSDSSDVDFYDFEVPEIAGSEHAVLTANLLSLTPSGLIPKLEVFDSSMNQIEHSVLVNGNGEFVVQSDQMESGEKYYVRVVANSPGNGFDTGNYDLQISFGQELLGMQDFGSGTLDDSNNTGHHTLYVAETQLFHFALAAADAVAATSPQAAIWMTIFDEDSNVVYRVATQPGETRTAKSVVLRPGSYSVQVFLALTPGSQPAGQPFSYSIQGNSVSEPTGPEIVDPSQMPFPPCNPNGPNFCYPNNNPSPNPFIFVNGEFVSTAGTTNPPYLDPNVWYWFNQWLTQNVPSSP